ncbi:2OG-Fe(II) oxygenase superfamily protein [Tessaracoccus bendigoensis DSM 12906]|uniref:2OG-Fe(II) oxygenase superfamily protein n=1 Tax=Tessaracoccus bendigoensis DSM 12906 TaxID=1123357 RepID=A0A1M6EP11_9ACTN|nr:2OG-Fe(II) oxygenase [Tessaracoccus bendigoensis]SHI87202.1 2OG-Fe(II) oxygenase superfamily protein [Tessaracoccus bendigoensis DSM 12906]
MVKPARERIALLLQGGESTGSFSAEATVPAAGVTLAVDGVGPVKLPIGAAQERMLVSVARPAMFGHGEETLTDPSVRDTWELTADQVSLGGAWEQVLEAVLLEVHEGLGLPQGSRLRAEPHALLVYGPDQFFAPHQDSEKDDEMVATLVVSLPSIHTGGELVVSHGGQSRTYRHSARDSIGFVAFYADCIHEVLPVRSGRRVTLTFNLLVTRESEEEIDPDEELASLVGEHFATPMTPRWSTEVTSVPNHLVVLLDHQYSERGLAAGRLKGRDVEWVNRLRVAAGRADCLSALALAEIRQTWNAYEEHRSWRYRYDDDESLANDGSSESYDLGELIEDEISLGWWKRSGVGDGEPIRLGVNQGEVCAVTPTDSLTPYQSEYEGYMGNYGNTVDRWYRRAAIVLWPKERDFIARAEADLPHAIAELIGRLKDGDDLDRARTDARAVVNLLRVGGQLLAPLLAVAESLDDAELAHDLLAPLGSEGLTAEHAPALAAVVNRYGRPWSQRLIGSWFPTRGHRLGRWEWATDTLPGVALALRRAGADGVVTDICRRIWANLSGSIGLALVEGPRAWAANVSSIVEPAESLFRVAEAEVVDEFVATLAATGDGVLDLELPMLRRLGSDAPASLVEDAVKRLEVMLAAPPRPADDWSIVWSGCGCDLCETLRGFLADRGATEFDWPLRTDGRQHIHQRIEAAELPVTHHTIRKGRPYTLHLAKRPDLHEREAVQRRQATTDLAWLREGRG